MSSFRLTSFSNSVDTCVFIRTEGSGSGSSYCLNNAVANTSDNVNSGDCDRLPAFQPFSKGLWWHPGVSGPWGPVSVSPTPLVETLGQAGWDKIPTLTEKHFWELSLNVTISTKGMSFANPNTHPDRKNCSRVRKI